MRESYINYVLFLVVLDKTKVIDYQTILGEGFDLISVGNFIINKIEQSIKEENDESGMEVESEEFDFLNYKGEKFSDYLTLFILRTFFMIKSQ